MKGKLNLKSELDYNKITYHDPCYLGRGNDIYDAPRKLIDYGKNLNSRLEAVASEKGFNLVSSGVSSMPYYRLEGESFETHIKWIDECVKRGVYMLSYHNHFISLAHKEEDIDFIESAARQAFESL